MNYEEVAAAILTRTIVESSPSLRDGIEKRAKKHEYTAIATDLTALYREVLNAIDGSGLESGSGSSGSSPV
jgi:hypothetical protein